MHKQIILKVKVLPLLYTQILNESSLIKESIRIWSINIIYRFIGYQKFFEALIVSPEELEEESLRAGRHFGLDLAPIRLVHVGSTIRGL